MTIGRSTIADSERQRVDGRKINNGDKKDEIKTIYLHVRGQVGRKGARLVQRLSDNGNNNRE